MLHAMLTTLDRTGSSKYQRYLFAFDRGAHRQNHSAITSGLSCEHAIVKRNHKYVGSTYNILESLKSCAEQAKPTDLIYVIADDVLLTSDFFIFHEQAHRLDPQASFVSATPGPRKMLSSDKASLIYKAHLVGELRAISFKAYRLSKILEHATPKYYKNMIGYCAEHLDVGLPVTDVEAPGLVRRVFGGLTIGNYGLYPVVPRACHIGYAGTNRGGRPEIEKHFNPTDWAEDSRAIRAMSSDQLNALALPEYRDIERCNLITDVAHLRLV